MGVAGAGKSLIGARFARAAGVEFLEGDDYHPATNVAKMAGGVPLTDTDRAAWLATLGEQLKVAHGKRVGIVIACSALKRVYRDMLRRDAGAQVRFIYLRVPRDVLVERLTHRRGHFMPATLLDSQLATLEEPADEEHAWVVDATLPPDRIVASLMQRVSE